MNTLKKFEARQAAQALGERTLPDFSPGDTLKVNVKIREGSRERVQAFEGLCIARHGKIGDINASFTVRKISLGEGVERVFPLYSPRLESVELIRRGSVRRAKLYYLRDRRGKAARIAERTTGHGIDKNNEKRGKKAGAAKKAEAKTGEKTKEKAKGKPAQAAAKTNEKQAGQKGKSAEKSKD